MRSESVVSVANARIRQADENGTFTAASNATGKVCDVMDGIAATLHLHGALAFSDYYATAGAKRAPKSIPGISPAPSELRTPNSTLRLRQSQNMPRFESAQDARGSGYA